MNSIQLLFIHFKFHFLFHRNYFSFFSLLRNADKAKSNDARKFISVNQVGSTDYITGKSFILSLLVFMLWSLCVCFSFFLDLFDSQYHEPNSARTSSISYRMLCIAIILVSPKPFSSSWLHFQQVTRFWSEYLSLQCFAYLHDCKEKAYAVKRIEHKSLEYSFAMEYKEYAYCVHSNNDFNSIEKKNLILVQYQHSWQNCKQFFF